MQVPLPRMPCLIAALFLLLAARTFAQPFITGDQVAGPLQSQDVPDHGTFWFVQQHHPPLPWNPFPELPVYLLTGTNGFQYLVDDSELDYVALREQQAIDLALRRAESELGIVQTMSIEWPPGGGVPDPGVTNLPVAYNYPTGAFYLEMLAVTNDTALVALHGTVADELYQLLSKQTLTDAVWVAEGEPFLGQDALTLTTFPVLDRTNSLFLQARSWQDSDGSGLPDWWQVEHFGQTGVDPYGDPDGDGWVNLREYEHGTRPIGSGSIDTPPAPTGLQLHYNRTNGAVLVSWLASPGIVQSYTVEREGDSPLLFSNHTTTSLTDTPPPTDLPDWFGPAVRATYRVRANYSNGAVSYWSERLPVQRVAYSVILGPSQIQAVPSRNGQTVLTLGAIPPETKSIRLSRIADVAHRLYGSSASDANWEVLLDHFAGGSFTLTPEMTESPVDIFGESLYWWWAQAVGEGWESEPVYLGSSDHWEDDAFFGATPFIDGRRQLKENLEFIFRAANCLYPLDFTVEDLSTYYALTLRVPTNYVSSSFVEFAPCGITAPLFRIIEVTPFRDNLLLRNLAVGSISNLDEQGSLIPNAWTTDQSIAVPWPPKYFLNGVVTNGTTIPGMLSSNNSKWTYMYPGDFVYTESFGIYWDETTSRYMMEEDTRNIYGLPFASLLTAWGNTPSQIATNYPGGEVRAGETGAFVYPETQRPALETTEYLFFPSTGYYTPAKLFYLPGEAGFNPFEIARPPLIADLGNNSFQVYGWARQRLTNGHPEVYGFLGQYFDRALVIDEAGECTTNSAGFVTEYGNFFPTQPGRAALITLPDLDTGERGTAVVHVVKLQLDVNHDGVMELGFGSPDNTSEAVPFRFWVNNDFDRLALDIDDNAYYEDSITAPKKPGVWGWMQSTVLGWMQPPDGDYRDANGTRRIPTTRDLEDYSRLRVCGITTNLLAALPPDTRIMLDWGDVENPQTNNPTIDLFGAADADGGIGYLTNAATAMLQTNASVCRYIGRLGPGQSIQLNDTNQFPNSWAGEHLIWCGVSGGSGQLTLSISQGGTNTLAQTSAYIQLQDIKQMYERWTVGDSPAVPPTNHAYSAQEGLPPGLQPVPYPPMSATNTPYILFVHGWNLPVWEKDRFAERAFKRLYWQGYQGRFGSFRWPTDSGFKGTWTQLLLDKTAKHNFDRSEYTAWRSGAGLANLLAGLNQAYPGSVYLLAHSMGNVVCGEALRLAGTNRVVNTYIASQAAVTAHTYDSTVPNYSFVYLPLSLSADTPNIYRDRFAGNNGGGAGLVINYLNANDFALRRGAWQLNQLLKPDENVIQSDGTWTYRYNGSTSDPSPWNNFSKHYIYYVSTNAFTNTVSFDIVNELTNLYEVMGFAAESWTTALGATLNIENVANNVDLTSQDTGIWLSDTNNFSAHLWHSAQFRSANWQQKGYWRALLSKQNGFALQQP